MLFNLMIYFFFYNKTVQGYFHGYYNSHVPKLQFHFIVKLLLPEIH